MDSQRKFGSDGNGTQSMVERPLILFHNKFSNNSSF